MDDLTLRDYMKVIFRQKWIIILCIFTVSLTVAVGLKLQTKRYAATVKLLISAEKQSESLFYHDITSTQNTQLALTEAEIVTSMPVLDRAMQAILKYKPLTDFAGYERRFASPLKQKLIDRQLKKFNEQMDKYELNGGQKQIYLYRLALNDLKKNVKVTPVADTNIFTITVTDYDPVGAAIMANIISRSYIIFNLEQQLAEMQQKYGEKNMAISQLRDDINTMSQNLTGRPLDNVEAIGPANVKIIEQAYPPIEPIGTNKSITLILGFVMSIFLGLMLAFIFDFMDQTFKSPDDIERILGVPYLGCARKRNNVIVFKHIAEQIYMLMKDNSFKTLTFMATHKGEGVTTVTRNVGKYISSVMGHRVLIIDANPKHKQPRRKKGMAVISGLFEILEEKAEFIRSIQKVDDKLHFLPAGIATLNPSILLGSHHMADILKQAKERYEIVLIDTDSLSFSKDAMELSNTVDAIVMVVSDGKTRRHSAKSVLEGFKKRKAVILGAILNKRKFPSKIFI